MIYRLIRYDIVVKEHIVSTVMSFTRCPICVQNKLSPITTRSYYNFPGKNTKTMREENGIRGALILIIRKRTVYISGTYSDERGLRKFNTHRT